MERGSLLAALMSIFTELHPKDICKEKNTIQLQNFPTAETKQVIYKKICLWR